MSADQFALFPFRRLTCRSCQEPVDVLELPDPYIDEHDYVCGKCLGRIKAGELPVPYNVLPPGY